MDANDGSRVSVPDPHQVYSLEAIALFVAGELAAERIHNLPVWLEKLKDKITIDLIKDGLTIEKLGEVLGRPSSRALRQYLHRRGIKITELRQRKKPARPRIKMSERWKYHDQRRGGLK